MVGDPVETAYLIKNQIKEQLGRFQNGTVKPLSIPQ